MQREDGLFRLVGRSGLGLPSALLLRDVRHVRLNFGALRGLMRVEVEGESGVFWEGGVRDWHAANRHARVESMGWWGV